MVDELEKNLFLINAPAGSGKTTTIHQTIEKIVRDEADSRVLCITYTKRAVEELRRRIQSNTVKIMTIHAFLIDFMKPYFVQPKIVELYFEVYGDKINEKILKDTAEGEASKSYKRYVEKYGSLDEDTIKTNVKKIYYNELQFNSLYYGGISHDDLLSFSKIVAERFPLIRKRLVKNFQYIFIDEYQDSSADVLRFFYDAVKGSRTKLYLYGDRMQQIYDKYDGSFEKQFKEFDVTQKLRTNYRSAKPIVSVLNSIYNNKEYDQHMPEEEKVVTDSKPKVIITDDIEKRILQEEKAVSGDVLKLYISNKRRFVEIGAGKLYEAIERLENEDGKKIYDFSGKFSPVDVLTKEREENPESLFRVLFVIDEMLGYYQQKKYGNIIQMIRINNREQDWFFNKNIIDVRYHTDKVSLNKKMQTLETLYSVNSQVTIGEFLKKAESLGILHKSIWENFSGATYDGVFKVNICEVVRLCEYNRNPHVSTQHGVKGEGHDKVFFVAEDNSNLKVDMYGFFKMLTELDVEFQSLQDFYYEYMHEIQSLDVRFGTSYKEYAKDYKALQEQIEPLLLELDKKFDSNKYYKYLYKQHYTNYLNGKAHKYIKAYTKLSHVKNILNAFKLFYVGCSRAKLELCVFVDENEIKRKGIEMEFANTFKKLGFEVVKQ